MIITISGYPGSGKSTVGKLLAKKLGYKYYSIGAMRRAMAKERGMTLQEFNVLGEKHPFTDVDIDRWQAKLGRENDNLVIEGRTSFHFIPHSIKIFLKVSIPEAARRIFHDPSHVRRFEASHHYQSPKQLEHGLRGRIASDQRRYKKYYGLNIFLPKHYDLVVDSSRYSAAETFRRIHLFVRRRLAERERSGITTKISTGLGQKKKTSAKMKITAKVKRKKKV